MFLNKKLFYNLFLKKTFSKDFIKEKTLELSPASPPHYIRRQASPTTNKNAPIKGHSHLIKTIYTNTKPQSTMYKESR
jgi:hypothetical protein